MVFNSPFSGFIVMAIVMYIYFFTVSVIVCYIQTHKLLSLQIVFVHTAMIVPDTVENISIWIHSQHDVLHCSVMNERTLGMNKEDIWHPYFLHKSCIKCSALVVG